MLASEIAGAKFTPTKWREGYEQDEVDEFLVEVKKEADGAFYRCSRGHPEWKTLEDSLKNKDQSFLQNQMAKMHRDVIGGADEMVMDY